jgi:arginine utilization regulatory protein
MNQKLVFEAFNTLLSHVEEGVHIVDAKGVTQVYNQAMETIEGMSAKDVLHCHVLEAYKGWQEENSTLLTVLKTQKPLHRQNQKYLNLLGKPISTINTTLPLFHQGELVGAIEMAQNYTDVSNLSDELQSLRAQLIKPTSNEVLYKKPHYTFDMLIGKSKAYLAAIKIAKRAANTSSSVMIIGETGTGKELFAQSIHYESMRRDKPFLAINCAAMPETLLESLLFGTTKGSFTGALDRPGLFEQAHGGTLFLDEINSMSLGLQAKLLRVLQEGYVRRVGGLAEISIDVRIIAATNEKPENLVQHGDLRKDLYYRVNVLSIYIPALKERPEDITLLVDYFIRYFNVKMHKNIWMLSEEVMAQVKEHPWRGNVRELQNFIESAMNMVQDEHVIHLEHLASHWQEQFFHVDLTDQGLENQENLLPLNEQLELLELDLISNRMAYFHGNISKTASSLGISRQNLQYKLKKLNI